MAAERHGVPIRWVIDGASRNDVRLLRPTLEAVADAELLCDVETLHLDRGYDYPAVRCHLTESGIQDASIQGSRTSTHRPRSPNPIVHRWIVESTNSWLSN